MSETFTTYGIGPDTQADDLAAAGFHVRVLHRHRLAETEPFQPHRGLQSRLRLGQNDVDFLLGEAAQQITIRSAVELAEPLLARHIELHLVLAVLVEPVAL